MESPSWVAIINMILNVVLVIGGGVIGSYVKGQREVIKQLSETDTHLTAKVNSMEVLLVGQYITRAEFRDTLERIEGAVGKLSDALFRKLDSISDKVDMKADKT